MRRARARPWVMSALGACPLARAVWRLTPWRAVLFRWGRLGRAARGSFPGRMPHLATWALAAVPGPKVLLRLRAHLGLGPAVRRRRRWLPPSWGAVMPCSGRLGRAARGGSPGRMPHLALRRRSPGGHRRSGARCLPALTLWSPRVGALLARPRHRRAAHRTRAAASHPCRCSGASRRWGRGLQGFLPQGGSDGVSPTKMWPCSPSAAAGGPTTARCAGRCSYTTCAYCSCPRLTRDVGAQADDRAVDGSAGALPSPLDRLPATHECPWCSPGECCCFRTGPTPGPAAGAAAEASEPTAAEASEPTAAEAFSAGAANGDPAQFEMPVGRWRLGERTLPWHLVDDWREANQRFPDTDSVGDSGQRGVQLRELADVVLAALRRWPSRDGKRYAMSLLAGTTGAAHDGYRPNGVVLCSLMRNAVIRTRQGDAAADPHLADPYDYVGVDTYLPGGANQLPRASSLEGVRLLALGSCLPEDAAAAPALAPPGQSRPPAPRRPVGVRLRSSSSRAEFSEAEDGVGRFPVVPWDPMAPPVMLLGMRSPGAIAAREHDPVRGVRVGEAANPGPRGGEDPRAAGACPGLVGRGPALPGRLARGIPRQRMPRRLRAALARRARAGWRAMARWLGWAARGADSSPGRMPHLALSRRSPLGRRRRAGPRPACALRAWVPHLDGRRGDREPRCRAAARWFGHLPATAQAVPRRPSADEAVWGTPRRRAGPRIAGALRWWAELRRRRVLPARPARWAGLRRRRVGPARRAWAGWRAMARWLGRAARWVDSSPGQMPHLALSRRSPLGRRRRAGPRPTCALRA